MLGARQVRTLTGSAEGMTFTPYTRPDKMARWRLLQSAIRLGRQLRSSDSPVWTHADGTKDEIEVKDEMYYMSSLMLPGQRTTKGVADTTQIPCLIVLEDTSPRSRGWHRHAPSTGARERSVSGPSAGIWYFLGSW